MDQDYKMSPEEWQYFNTQKKKDRLYEENRYYCYCGHSVTILPRESRTFCTHCGHWVYKDEERQLQNIKNIQLEIKRKKEEIKKDKFIKELKERLKNAI